ncbi:MAG: DEAD/DEAH box helicase [Candidatus Omnitrophica bacterium]|nr:DEAD/DEAH box helicase [Candidatus Omnitrophota bacterium]
METHAGLAHPFEYDPFQKEAIACIRKGISVFVSAPTGAGKTVIAEVAVEQAMHLSGGRSSGAAIYTAPIKAVSNQKFRDFHACYGEKVGILTGDVTINPGAPLLIMTTEIYRNSLLEEKGRFSSCRWIIFDEVHFLDDPERGTVWEEALLLTPRQTEILALSATIPNAAQLAAWIEKIHGRPVKVIQENHRPVPLRFSFQCQNQLFSNMEILKKNGYAGFDRKSEKFNRPFRMMRRHRRGGRAFFKGSPGFSGPPAPYGKPNRAPDLLKAIRNAGHLPCLYFTFSRKRTEELAWEFAGLGLAEPETKSRLLEEFDRLCRKYEISGERSSWSMRELIAQGIAFHHAGLLPTLKEVIEQLFSKRLIQVIVTTETFALGINMPARCVVLDTLVKRMPRFSSDVFVRSVLKVRELSQMAGRAGRRGMDEMGFVYLRINPWEVPFPELTRLLHGKPEEVSSRFNLTYATVLNLYKSYLQNLFEFYEKTLHAFQSSPLEQKEARDLIRRKLTLLQEMGYVAQGGKLTSKGVFAISLYGYELFLSEMFEAGVLDELDMTDLGILLFAAVYEPPRKALPVQPPHRLKGLVLKAHEVMTDIHQAERRLRIKPFTKPPAFHLSVTVEKWISGASFEKVVQASDEDEGGLIRFMRMTVQLCRALATAPAASAALKEKTSKLIHRINRDQVDAEAELRRCL